MRDREPPQGATRWIPGNLLVGLLVVIGAIGPQLLSSSSSTASSPIVASPTERIPPRQAPTGAPGDAGGAEPDGPMVPRGELRGALDEAHGIVPDGTTIFDDELPAIANLDPALLRALRRAASDAAEDGVEVAVQSGWRSAAYQDELLRQAVSTYGSVEEAARWVATADTSPHVSGDAVDVGRADAAAWLSEHGAEYGICQIYRNEPWHFELRPEAIEEGCPRMYSDPTRDPRMR